MIVKFLIYFFILLALGWAAWTKVNHSLLLFLGVVFSIFLGGYILYKMLEAGFKR